MSETRIIHVPTKGKFKLNDINFDELDVVTLMQIQARLSRVILEKSR